MHSELPEVSVFVVDDDAGLLRLLEKALQRQGFSTATASSGKEAVDWLQAHRAELMLLDLQLQDSRARDLIEKLTTENHCPPFIIITGQGDERVAVEMMKSGALDYLVKDADLLQLVPEVVKRALGQIENEKRLAAAEEQVHLVRSVVEQGFSAVLITTAEMPDPLIVYVNPAFASATGYTYEKVVGKPLSSLGTLTRVQERLKAGLPAGAPFIEEVSTFQTAQGERWGEWRVAPVKAKTGKNTHWVVIVRDITERRRLEKEILEISDQERRRLGQDLHDGLCQHLAGIELMSQVLEQKLAARSKAGARRAGEIASHVREAISQTRALARGLAPATLESEGLSSALDELGANTEKMFGVKCRVQHAEWERRLPTTVATHLYRIAQEAVSNAIRHGKATEVAIRLEDGTNRLSLTISDNGTGMGQNSAKSDGMGLRIMQYRAGMIGGTLWLDKSDAGGTMVICRLPESVRAIPAGSRQSETAAPNESP